MVSLIFFVFLFFSCTENFEETGDIYARVDESILTKEDVYELKKSGPVGRNTVKHIVNSWVEKTLLYKEALNINLDKDKTLLDKKNLFYKNLLIESFLSIKTKKDVKISKKEISNYYLKNKKSFVRQADEILLKHFVLPTKKESNKLKKLIRSNNKGNELEDYIEKYKPEIKTIKKDLINEGLIGFVFNSSSGDVLGPKKINDSFHVFEILQRYEKGSVRGLELVYDEIYQRLFKIKEIQYFNNFLDSLYLSSDIYISPEVSK